MEQYHVLLVDGSEGARALIARRLETLNNTVKVTPANSAEEALELIEGGQKFDLVSTALMLPGMDGMQLASRLRHIKGYEGTPIVIASASADNNLRRLGFNAAISGYFDKSLGIHKLADYILHFLPTPEGLSGDVLYVEDSATAALAVRKTLEAGGLKVHHYKTAEEAYDAAQTAFYTAENGIIPFQLVLSDVNLKGEWTGFDLLRKVREELHIPASQLPFLILTGDDADEIDAIFEAGANGYIVKPIDPALLMQRLHTLMQTRIHMGLEKSA